MAIYLDIYSVLSSSIVVNPCQMQLFELSGGGEVRFGDCPGRGGS